MEKLNDQQSLKLICYLSSEALHEDEKTLNNALSYCYKIAHIHSSNCKNPHTDWLLQILNTYKKLEKEL